MDNDIIILSSFADWIFDQRVSLFQGFIKALIVFMETFGGIVLGYLSLMVYQDVVAAKFFRHFYFCLLLPVHTHFVAC